MMKNFIAFYLIAVGAVYSDFYSGNPFYSLLLPIGLVLGGFCLFRFGLGSLFLVGFSLIYFSEFGDTRIYRSAVQPLLLWTLAMTLLLSRDWSAKIKRVDKRLFWFFYKDEEDDFEEYYSQRWEFRYQKPEPESKPESNTYYEYHKTDSEDRIDAPPLPISALDEAYLLLGVKPENSDEDVKKAYRRLLARNHPDRLMAQGLTPKELARANETTHLIRSAYETISQQRDQ